MDGPRPGDEGEAAAVSDPLLGRTLDGKYQLHDKLGEGGMGAVYRATHTLMGKACAVKVLRGPQAVQDLAAKRFQREAQSASRLDHENCIRVTDFGRTPDGIAYLVMELLEGRSLAEELADGGALPLPRLMALARQVAAALAHAHELGVVHRDLKPDNIMLVERSGAETVKVLDFGLAKLVEAARPTAGSLTTLSEVGSVFGTPEYMSPEQAQGLPLDARTDVYSFGVVLYQMMTGQLPFQAGSFIAVLSKHMTETPVSPSVRRPDLGLPAGLVALVLKCLEKDPAARPQRARDVVEALATMPLEVAPRVPVKVASHPTVELSQAIEEAEDVPPARSRWPLWVAAGVLAAGVAAAVVMAGRSKETGDRRPATGDRQPASSEADVAAVAIAAPAPVAVPAPVPDAAPVAVPAPAPAPVAETETERPTRDADKHLAAAARYRKAGNRIKELFFLQQALRADPGNREAMYRLGAALIEDGQHDLGCARLAKAGNVAKTLYEKAGCRSPAEH